MSEDPANSPIPAAVLAPSGGPAHRAAPADHPVVRERDPPAARAEPAVRDDRAAAGRWFLLAVAVYFLLQTLTRISLSDSLDMDEAEAVLWFQEARLGYGTQPPLYAWLQWLMFSVFGVNILALAALKNAMLFATYAAMFQLARPMLGTLGAMAVAASLLLFPEIGFESHRDRTHSVLLITMASLTLWSYFAVVRQPSPARFALLGLVVALGLQSKYNFAMIVVGLAGASLLVAEHRRAVWTSRLWIAVAVAVVCLAPHGLWLVQHLDAATSGTVQKMQEGYRGGAYLSNLASGAGSLLVALSAALALPALVFGLACRAHLRRAALDWRSPDTRFFAALYLILASLMSALLLSGEISNIKVRWIMPLVFSMPLALFVAWPALARPEVHARILRISAVLALVLLLSFQLRFHLGPAFGRHTTAHYPYAQLAAEIERRFPAVGHVVVPDLRVAGNLLFHRPAVRPLILDRLLSGSEPLEGEALIVMPGGNDDGWLQRVRAGLPASELRQSGRLLLPYREPGRGVVAVDYAHFVPRTP